MSTLTLKELSAPAGEVIKIAAGKTLDLKSQGSVTMPTGSVLQVVYFQTGAVITGTTNTPHDDTIPQITEGVEFMTLAITPKSATSILAIRSTALLSVAASRELTMALHVGTTVDALAATVQLVLTGADAISTLDHNVVAGVTSELTFRIRVGQNGGATAITLNGLSGGRKFGGVAASGITITEYAA